MEQTLIPALQNELKGIKQVRIISANSPFGFERRDDEINEALKLGWRLLSIEPGPLFVVGWPGAEEAPKTKRQLRGERLAEIGRGPR